jgi:hypothetical protein
MPLDMPRQQDDLLLLASLFLFELSIAVIPMALYMKGDRSFAVFLPSKPGLVLCLALGTIVITGAAIINQYLLNKRLLSRHFSLIVAMNLVTVIVMLVTAEIAIRAASHRSVEGETVGGVVLSPKTWQTVAQHYRQLIDQRGGDLAYLVYDDVMGWTTGPNRRSANGLYRSSSEGIRAPEEGMSFPLSTGKTRIALVGDSFTFGEDVRYEETWGYFLEKELGSKFQVLNFGVSGYGVDQMFLKYEKDIRRWKPEVVIFGFISHDTVRSMLVYPFLTFPEWDMPFAKPRFIVRDGELTNINAHPAAPQAIFSVGSILELAAIEYDKGYKQSDWVENVYHQSYLWRRFVSSFPRWSIERADVTDVALVDVNASILKKFVRSATQAGVIPVVVFFPNKEELERASVSPLTKKVLQQSGIAYTDLTSCLLPLNAADRFVPEHRHYSPQGNALVANCLDKVVNEALGQATKG